MQFRIVNFFNVNNSVECLAKEIDGVKNEIAAAGKIRE